MLTDNRTISQPPPPCCGHHVVYLLRHPATATASPLPTQGAACCQMERLCQVTDCGEPAMRQVRVLHLIDHLGPGGSQTTLVDLLEVRAADIDPAVWCLSRRILPELSDRLERTGVLPQVLGLSKANPWDAVGLRRRLMSA